MRDIFFRVCYTLSCIVFLSGSISAFAASDSAITVSKLRIVIDDVTYEWTAGGRYKAKPTSGIADSSDTRSAENAGALSFTAVASFLDIAPGMEVSLSSLEKKCRAAEIRLERSALVYAAEILILPSRKNPSERTVLATVSSGFFWRFGGGNSWALFGRDAIGGERQSLTVIAGWNRNGLRYERHAIAGTGLFAGSSVFWHGPASSVSLNPVNGLPDSFDFETSVRTGWDVSPDLSIGTDIAFTGFSSDVTRRLSIQPFVQWTRYFIPETTVRRGFETDAELTVRGYVFPGTDLFKGEFSASVHIPVGTQSLWATRLSVGAGSPAETSGAVSAAGFDLLSVQDRSIRSGYTELFARRFMLSSVELRHRIIRLAPLSGFTLDIQLFGFADGAVFVEEQTSALKFAESTGSGARLLFDNPVFLYLTCTYGINRFGEGRFLLSGTAGY
jgi:hypothetical protein